MLVVYLLFLIPLFIFLSPDYFFGFHSPLNLSLPSQPFSLSQSFPLSAFFLAPSSEPLSLLCAFSSPTAPA